MTSRLAFFAAICIIFTSFSFAIDNNPITTPASIGDMDDLSRFYRPYTEHQQKKNIKDERPLIGKYIEDPRVIFSTYFGGNGYDCANSIATDNQGNVYFVGYSGSTDLKTTEGAYQKEKKAGHDAFAAKFTSDGKAVWITYLGGSKTDVAVDCFVDNENNLVLTGKTDSPDFPVTNSINHHGSADIFVTKFNPDGNMILSVCIGDTAFEAPEAMKKYGNDGFIITGYTNSPGLAKGEVFQNTFAGVADAFASRFDNQANLVWLSYLGGGQYDAAHSCDTDAQGNIAICGDTKFGQKGNVPKFPVSNNAFQKDTTGRSDCFICVFTPDGKRKWSTLVGGKSTDQCNAIGVDNEGNISFSGSTLSTDFPVTDNAYQKNFLSVQSIYIGKFNKDGQRLWITYFGQMDGGNTYDMSVDEKNNIWITGYFIGNGLPTTADAIFGHFNGDKGVMCISKLNTSGYPVWSSYYYGGGLEFAYKIIATDNKFLFAGEEGGHYFPVTKGAFQEMPAPVPSVYDGCVVSVDLEHTDVSEIENHKNISISMNNSEIIISTDDNYELIKSVSITDILGRRVYYNNFEGKINISIPINVLNITHSLYILKITTNQNTLIHKFFY